MSLILILVEEDYSAERFWLAQLKAANGQSYNSCIADNQHSKH